MNHFNISPPTIISISGWVAGTEEVASTEQPPFAADEAKTAIEIQQSITVRELVSQGFSKRLGLYQHGADIVLTAETDMILTALGGQASLTLQLSLSLPLQQLLCQLTFWVESGCFYRRVPSEKKVVLFPAFFGDAQASAVGNEGGVVAATVGTTTHTEDFENDSNISRLHRAPHATRVPSIPLPVHPLSQNHAERTKCEIGCATTLWADATLTACAVSCVSLFDEPTAENGGGQQPGRDASQAQGNQRGQAFSDALYGSIPASMGLGRSLVPRNVYSAVSDPEYGRNVDTGIPYGNDVQVSSHLDLNKFGDTLAQMRLLGPCGPATWVRRLSKLILSQNFWPSPQKKNSRL
ncbi:hypothetical protein K449DRAFT_437591 [Hypoxylon sp. EC38]|nr:hypothetical protein K449DRAFT_437591 [Hypoxylon sp. EC38]